MSLIEKILWSVLTLASAFVLISIVSEDLQPHRFLFGIPFSFSLFVVMATISMLTGGRFMKSVAAVIPESLSQRGWWLLILVMVLRWMIADFIRGYSGGTLLNNLLMCVATAFLLLVDTYQRSADWPRFFLPELGQISKPNARRTQILPGNKASGQAFSILSCCLAIVAIMKLQSGLSDCLLGSDLQENFFISELGIGRKSHVFTSTLWIFGVLLIPFFLNFVLCFPAPLPPEAVKFSIGGCCAVCGIIGIGIWDLHSPLHYLSIAVWLWPLVVILDQFVPTPRGFIDLRFPTWIVKATMAGYVMSMMVFPFSHDLRVMCIWLQRLVVLSTLTWLAMLWKTMFFESVGLGEKFNAIPQEWNVR